MKMTGRGKRITLAGGALALGVLIVFGFAAKDRVVEEYYVRQLASGGAADRIFAIDNLGSMRSVRSVPHLIRLIPTDLPDRYSDQSKCLIKAFIAIGRPAVPALLELLNDENWLVREFGLWMLSNIGSDPADLPSLVRALKDERAEIRQRAAWLLGRLGPEAAEATVNLASIVQDSSRGVRRSAAEALGEIGPKAIVAVPALLKAQDDRDGIVREKAIEAVKKIRGR